MPRKIAEELRAAYFWSRVQVRQPHECWPWRGHVKKNGYGAWSIHHGKTVHAHRVAWELTYGAIPDGLFVCHNCPGGDNRLCCNPRHLWLGTHQQNMDDARRKGRLVRPAATHCRRGHTFGVGNDRRDALGKRVCVICDRLVYLRRWDRLRPGLLTTQWGWRTSRRSGVCHLVGDAGEPLAGRILCHNRDMAPYRRPRLQDRRCQLCSQWNVQDARAALELEVSA